MLNAIMDKDTYQMTKNKAQNRDEWRWIITDCCNEEPVTMTENQ